MTAAPSRALALPRLLRAGAIAALATGALSASSEPPRDALALDRVLGKEVQRAQREFVDSLDLWPESRSWDQARVVRGPHTEIRTCRSALHARRIQELLEANFDAIDRLLDVRSRPQAGRRVPIWIAPDIPTYNQIGSGGDEVSSRYGGWYCQTQEPPVVLTSDLGTWTHLWVLHAATQEVLARRNLLGGPAWIRHALPAFLELQPANHYRFGVTEWERVREQEFTPLRALLRDPQHWSDDQLREAGMLLEYLAFHCEETSLRADGTWPLAEYLRRCVRDEAPEESTVTDLLANLRELEERFVEHSFPPDRLGL